MTTTNNRLIGVIGVDVQTAASEDPGKDVTGSRHALARCSTNGDGERVLHAILLACREGNAAMKPRAQTRFAADWPEAHWPEGRNRSGRTFRSRLPGTMEQAVALPVLDCKKAFLA